MFREWLLKESSDMEASLMNYVKRNIWRFRPTDDLSEKTQSIVSSMYDGGGTITANLIQFYGDSLPQVVAKAIEHFT